VTLVSYRAMRVRELKDGLRARHRRGGALVERTAKLRTPIGSPATTGKPNYPVTHHLQNSIKSVPHPNGEEVSIGTNVPYARYVHNGTGPHFRGSNENWTEGEAQAYWAIYLAQYPGYEGPHSPPDPNDDAPFRGMMPRGFLVNGLLKSRPGLKAIYGQPIIGKPPHG
jgi:hypothetical protein